MACVCDTIPGNLRAYVNDEPNHPAGKSNRHMHIEKRGTRFYWVEWGIDKKGWRFINVLPTREGNDRFSREIARWVDEVFDELTVVYERVVKEIPFEKVKWTR